MSGPVLTTWIGSSCDCSIAAADGVEDATGRVRLDKGADEFPVSAVNEGATSGGACAMFCFAILDVPVLPRVATDAGFSVTTGFSAGDEFFSAIAFADDFSAVDFEAGGMAIVLEAAGVAAPELETGCALPDGGKLAGGTFAASCVCCGAAAVLGFCIFRKANVDAAAITSTATTPTIMNLLPDFLSSAATESNVPKFARGAASARFSSFLGGVARGTTSRGTLLIGSALAGAVAAPRGLEGLITTAGGAACAGGCVCVGVGTATGLAVITGIGGRGASTCGFSSRARRSFCSNAEIWSAMVFSTATCVIVKACGVGANAANTPTTRFSSRMGVTTIERIPSARIAAVSTRVSVSQSSQRSSLPVWMHSPVKVPLTRRAAPTSGALAPLRARHTISSALPSLSAMATPEALVKAWARCATTARSSGEAPRPLLLAVLLAVSEAWVAMCTPVPQTLFFVF